MTFDPFQQRKRSLLWVNINGENCRSLQPGILDKLKDIPRATEPNAYYTSIDDKSGFDNLKLKPGSGGLIAFQWGGYYFQFLSIPFGLKLSNKIRREHNVVWIFDFAYLLHMARKYFVSKTPFLI